MPTRMGAVSNSVFAVTTIVFLIVAGSGYVLYATHGAGTITSTIISTTTYTPTSTKPLGLVGGFLNGQIVTFEFFTPSQCSPSLTTVFPNSSEAQNASTKTTCEVGAPGTFPSNTLPVWGVVPAFAGLSLFGLSAFGASSQGFAVYDGTVILSDCIGGGHPPGCPDHPPLVYSPVFSMVEKYMGITNGVMGLPQGVMPFPAHDHIVESAAGNQNIPWNAIAVMVFDPNIFPNPVTGTCTQISPSTLANATGNCLITTAALQRAMNTTNAGIAAANAKNPIWLALGKPMVQVVVAGATQPSQYRNANTNVDVPFAVVDNDPYPPYYTPGS